MNLEILTIESAPFAENSYLVWRRGAAEAFVVDPGFEPKLILDAVQERGLTVLAILNTHGHVDHIAGNAALREAFPEAPILVGREDAILLTDADANLSASFGLPITSPPPDQLLADGDRLTLAGINLHVHAIPGHSPGHVVYIIPQTTPAIVLGGDVLFRGSVGRTDFPGGSFPLLKAGILAKLWPLPDDTIVYPGHGPVTTIGHEKRTNPFVGQYAPA